METPGDMPTPLDMDRQQLVGKSNAGELSLKRKS